MGLSYSAVLVLRWLIDRPDVHLLARDAKVSQATAYWYLHEAIEVIAAHAHGGNVQVVTDPSGFPVWTCPVEPGSTHDITAAREHALPALYPAAAAGLPTLTDKGYTGVGIGIIVPTKGANLSIDNQARNLIITAFRAPAERANALLKSSFKALPRVTP